MKSNSVIPDRRLGQNFLVDRNILGIIERLAALKAEDVVLEIGPGKGVLTERLVNCVSHVHAVEIDERLRPLLEERVGGEPNLNLLFADALRADLSSLLPAPTKLVANLPYSIATPLLMESIHQLPSLMHWCVMVQQEIADRILAVPNTRSYGSVSVLLQLTMIRAGFHPVSRTCFHPVPRVDSALVALSRYRDWGSEYSWLRQVVVGAFGHRRKTLANSLELAGVSSRSEIVAVLERLGRSSSARAEEFSPEEFIKLANFLSEAR